MKLRGTQLALFFKKKLRSIQLDEEYGGGEATAGGRQKTPSTRRSLATMWKITFHMLTLWEQFPHYFFFERWFFFLLLLLWNVRRRGWRQRRGRRRSSSNNSWRKRAWKRGSASSSSSLTWDSNLLGKNLFRNSLPIVVDIHRWISEEALTVDDADQIPSKEEVNDY